MKNFPSYSPRRVVPQQTAMGDTYIMISVMLFLVALGAGMASISFARRALGQRRWY